MTKPAAPEPLTREMIGEVMDMGARAKGWLRNLPWAQAEAGMREVDEMIATVSECLPGGYRGRCACGAAIGNDDPVTETDGSSCCPFCFELSAGLTTSTPAQELEHA